MTQKTRSLLLFVAIILLIGVLTFLYRVEKRPAAQPNLGALTADASLVAPGSSRSSLTEFSIALSTESTPSTVVEPLDLSLLFVGDIMLDRNVAARTRNSQDPTYPFRKLADQWLAGFDLTIGNLEGPITPERHPPVKSIDFQFDPSWTSVLKNQGFDVFSQANNHALDQGSAGYADSVSILRKAGFTVFGHQVQDGLISLATTTVRGETVAFLGWNTTDNPIDLAQAELAIAQAKKEATLVIAFTHWGTEYRDHPDTSSVELGHWLIDHGVDVVVGGHPHWPQGVSSYEGKPIIWSLGNFVFDQDWSKETQQSLAAHLTVNKDEIRLKLIPLHVTKSQPGLEEGRALVTRLSGLAKVSDLVLRDRIENGQELIFPRY